MENLVFYKNRTGPLPRLDLHIAYSMTGINLSVVVTTTFTTDIKNEKQ